MAADVWHLGPVGLLLESNGYFAHGEARVYGYTTLSCTRCAVLVGGVRPHLRFYDRCSLFRLHGT